MNTCGMEDCASSCHRPGTSGRYCAPTRCYCGGCPGHVPVHRGRPVPPLSPPSSAVPMAEAPTAFLAARDQLRALVAGAQVAAD